MNALLMAHSPLTDLVGTEIWAGDVPVKSVPAVGIKEISRVEQDTVARSGPNTLVTARIQVTVYASSYPQQKALLTAAKLGPGVHTGEIAGTTVRSVLRDSVGPDLSNPEAGTFEQSRDFKVTYLEPN
ncbi:hypothetical protein [Massilia eurypsychrophila]|nr:hypothetical protein [Massilia eurypsychrophila]